MVAFHRPKEGSTAAEWEDGAGYDPGDPDAGRTPRCIVVDGATEAYDSIRWVGQLVESFLGLEAGGRPRLEADAMTAWFAAMQQQWVDRAPATFGTVFEEQKFSRHGSFATLLGCDLDLAGDTPSWRAVALGDAVLFHVRAGRLVGEFPPMARADFGIDPDGVFTQPGQLERMRAGVRFGTGPLLPGDVLLLCTDALAAWGVQEGSTRSQPWARLSDIDHPHTFAALVEEQLASRRLKNDDITLLRVTLSESPANVLVVCQ